MTRNFYRFYSGLKLLKDFGFNVNNIYALRDSCRRSIFDNLAQEFAELELERNRDEALLKLGFILYTLSEMFKRGRFHKIDCPETSIGIDFDDFEGRQACAGKFDVINHLIDTISDYLGDWLPVYRNIIRGLKRGITNVLWEKDLKVFY